VVAQKRLAYAAQTIRPDTDAGDTLGNIGTGAYLETTHRINNEHL